MHNFFMTFLGLIYGTDVHEM